MTIKHPYDWQFTPAQAKALQRELAARISQTDELGSVRFVAGVDTSIPRGTHIIRGAVVILQYPELIRVEQHVMEQNVPFPYVPGLLSFREAPAIMEAWAKLDRQPDLLLVDGQGIAHPRRLGLASHLGLLTDTPTIGVAKSRLCGEHEAVKETHGSYARLSHHGETIGAVLRTKSKIKPLYISTGHKISLETAVCWVLECCRGYRLPEPTRLAHLAAGGQLIDEK